LGPAIGNLTSFLGKSLKNQTFAGSFSKFAAMTLPTLLKDYAAYNLWANRQFADWLAARPEELLVRELPSSFPSLRLTALHVWGAEAIWLSRLHGVSPTRDPFAPFDGPTEAVFRRWLQTSAELRDYVEARDDAWFDGETAFTLLNGTSDARNNAQILLHVFQHGTLHRGQLITMARSLGLTDPPKTDYIHYVRMMALA
jgi:uncharacterized damage-inducible protein DinB